MLAIECPSTMLPNWKLRILYRDALKAYLCLADKFAVTKGFVLYWKDMDSTIPPMVEAARMLQHHIKEWDKVPDDALQWIIVGASTERPKWVYVRRWTGCNIHHAFGTIRCKNDGRWDWWVHSKRWNRWGYALHMEQGVAETFLEAQRKVEGLVATLAPKEGYNG